MHFSVTLMMLAVGWNFGFVGASALVLETHLPQERNKVQAFNDFLVFGTMAVGSFFSGQLLANYGWAAWSIRPFCSGSGGWRSPPLPGGGGPAVQTCEDFPTR